MSTNLDFIIELYHNGLGKDAPQPIELPWFLTSAKREHCIQLAKNYNPEIGKLWLKYDDMIGEKISAYRTDMRLAALAEYIASVDKTKVKYHQLAVRIISDKYRDFFMGRSVSDTYNAYCEEDSTAAAAKDLLLEAASWNRTSLRIGYDCSTCGNKWLVNPEFEEQQREEKKSAAWQDLSASVVISGGIGAHRAIRQLRQAGQMKPAFCPSCKGFENQERLVTYCAECKQLRTEGSLLDSCKCGFVILDKAYKEKSFRDVYFEITYPYYQ